MSACHAGLLGDNRTPVGSGRFRDRSQDPIRVLGTSFSLPFLSAMSLTSAPLPTEMISPLCWLFGTSVQKSWRHVPRRSIFPFCITSTKKYLCVKKIVSCSREENRVTKTKTYTILETIIVLHYITSPPLSLGEYDFHASYCSHAIFHLIRVGGRSIHNAPPLRASSSCFPVLC